MRLRERLTGVGQMKDVDFQLAVCPCRCKDLGITTGYLDPREVLVIRVAHIFLNVISILQTKPRHRRCPARASNSTKDISERVSLCVCLCPGCTSLIGGIFPIIIGILIFVNRAAIICQCKIDWIVFDLDWRKRWSIDDNCSSCPQSSQ